MNSSKSPSLTNSPVLASTLKRSPSFQTLRESIKRSSAKLVQKLTGSTDHQPPTNTTHLINKNDTGSPYEFKYSTKSESLKARTPVKLMSKLGYTKVSSNENLELNNSDEEDDDVEDDLNHSNHSSSDDLSKNQHFNSKYQR